MKYLVGLMCLTDIAVAGCYASFAVAYQYGIVAEFVFIPIEGMWGYAIMKMIANYMLYGRILNQ